MSLFTDMKVLPRQDITLILQITQQITWWIASGKLKAGDRLPPIKVLAKQLKVNIHTVRSAYLRLEAEGLVDARRGRGTHVLSFDLTQLARKATSFRSHTIGVIVPSWENPFYHAVLQGIEQVADEDQALLFLCNTHDDLNLALKAYARLVTKQVDGIIIISQDFCRSTLFVSPVGSVQNPLPVVSIDWPGCPGYSVNIDLKAVGYRAARHLLEHGHRRIGLISFSEESENIIPIHEGFLFALKEFGVEPDLELVARVTGFGTVAGSEGAKKFLSLAVPPTAVFAITDLLAIGAMKTIKMSGRRIPEDIAILGFNDIPAASVVDPPLSTLSVPANQAGCEAMKILQTLIVGGQPLQRKLILSPTLITRESCGCPQKEG